MYDELLKLSNNLGCRFFQSKPLKKYTSFKIGGPADLLITVNNQKALESIINMINKHEIPFFVLGNGSNLLVSDEGFNGVVLHLGGEFNKISLQENNILNCGAGAPLAGACVFAMQKNLSGLEFAWGIPGSCGGALFMNAGAYSKDVSDVVIQSTHITPNCKLQTLNKDQLNLSYRKSFYTNNSCIITSVKFKLENKPQTEIRSEMYGIISKRKAKQPLDLPNAGSIFKRPEGGHYAGSLIEQCGLKGASVGGAMVSKKHAGFIVNTGSATCSDVINLINKIKNKIFQETGVTLECEIKTLGDVKL